MFLIPALALAIVTACAYLSEYLKVRLGNVSYLKKKAQAAFSVMRATASYSFGALLILIAFAGDFLKEPGILYEDVWEVKDYLHSIGWNLDNQYRHVKSPQQLALVSTLAVHSPIDSSTSDQDDAGEDVYVFRTRAGALPSSLPGGWRVFPRGDGSALVVVRSQTWLNWTGFSLCRKDSDAAEFSCVDSGLHYSPPEYLMVVPPIPGLLHPSELAHQRVQIRFHLRIPPNAGEHVILMPVVKSGCRGRIEAVPDGNSRISTDGRKAALVSGEEPVDGTLVLEWIPGSRECPEESFGGLPPFFIEAETDTAYLMEKLLAGGG